MCKLAAQAVKNACLNISDTAGMVLHSDLPCHHLYSITKERGLLHSYTEDGIIIFQPVAEKFQYNYQYICPRHLCTRLWAEKFLENPSKLINYQSKSSKTVCNGQRKAGNTVKNSVQEQ